MDAKDKHVSMSECETCVEIGLYSVGVSIVINLVARDHSDHGLLLLRPPRGSAPVSLLPQLYLYRI